MLHTIALGAAIVSLGLLSAIYFCNFMSRPTSALRSEVVSMILISLLTGIFTLAVTATLVGFWFSLSGGVSMAALLDAGTDIRKTPIRDVMHTGCTTVSANMLAAEALHLLEE